ncbi:hypothetical protein G9A89_012658 [Geosiphon pyriformis]|nr:hypothetical protein G9A89_012658 [Geosiphon pyriformis]
MAIDRILIFYFFLFFILFWFFFIEYQIPSFVEDCAGSDVYLSHGFGVVCDTLLTVDTACLSVYTDGSLSGLGTVDVKAGAAAFFEDINLGLDVGVSGLVSSTLTELQAIALALECVSSFQSVDLFSDSQAIVDAYKSESLLVYLDFRNRCIPDNERADAFAKEATFSAWHLLYLVGEHFLKVGGIMVSDHVFSCSHNATGCAQLLDIHALAWAAFSGLSQSSSCVSQLLDSCVSKYCESVSVFKNSEVGASKIVDFVHGFCLAFWDDIWLVCARHWTFMEKHGLISCDGSAPTLVSGLFMVFSTGVVRLLDVAEAFEVGFGFCKFCPFFSGIGDLVSVHIGI